ncbi:hypothetical protein [Vibrio chaetopteri]|uniref:Uncharacterized protein n=1 Tax=Vibrio chaetopteri TaxID=3016528 RepID=A0AAU8BRU7_9VIBR
MNTKNYVVKFKNGETINIEGEGKENVDLYEYIKDICSSGNAVKIQQDTYDKQTGTRTFKLKATDKQGQLFLVLKLGHYLQ